MLIRRKVFTLEKNSFFFNAPLHPLRSLLSPSGAFEVILLSNSPKRGGFLQRHLSMPYGHPLFEHLPGLIKNALKALLV